LLTQLGIPFDVYPANIDETPIVRERPTPYVMRMAREKAEKVSEQFSDQPILAADTIVAVGTRILRKAESEQEVYEQLRLISGRRHRVYTALALRMPSGAYYTRLCVTHVAVKILDPQEIAFFVQSGEWRNVAVYRIEGIMGMYIRMIRGLSSTIQGLPLSDVYTLLKGHGLWKTPSSVTLSAGELPTLLLA
jgi:septum formation protein